MSYVLVTADFPGIDAEQRKKIYKCLEEKNWTKVTEQGRDIDTVWYAYFEPEYLEAACIRAAINHFTDCAKPYCNVKLAMQWGPNKPAFHGLV